MGQAEHVVALRTPEEIATVPGIDVVFLGPQVSQSLGFPGQHTVPQVVHAMDDAFNRLMRQSTTASGTAGNVEALERYRPLDVGYFYTHLTTSLQMGA